MISDIIKLHSCYLYPFRRVKGEVENNLKMYFSCPLPKICLNDRKNVSFMLKMKVKWILNHLNTVGLIRDLIWRFKQFYLYDTIFDNMKFSFKIKQKTMILIRKQTIWHIIIVYCKSHNKTWTNLTITNCKYSHMSTVKFCILEEFCTEYLLNL